MLVVVAGLFAMHGLASHGVEGMDVSSSAAGTSQPMAGSLMSVDVPPALVDGQKVASSDQSRSRGSNESGHGGMNMTTAVMCLAILGAALLALLHQLGVERSSRAIWARRHLARLKAPAARGVAPPSLTELSIQRC